MPSVVTQYDRHGRVVGSRMVGPSRGKRIRRAVVRAVWRSLSVLAVGVVGLLWSAARPFLVGRWRHQALPVWVCAAAGLVPVWQVWAATAAALAVVPAVRAWTRRVPARLRRKQLDAGGQAAAPRRYLSDREARLWAATAAMVATWWLLAAVLHQVAGVGHWPAVAIASVAAVPWWSGRRVPTPRAVPAIVGRWETEIAPAVPALHGSVLTQYEDLVEGPDGAPAGDALILLPPGGKASAASRTDEDVESLLGMHRGTVTISARPDLPVRQVKIRFSDLLDAGRLRFWEGPTLTDDGRFTGGTAGTDSVRGCLWVDDSAANHAAIGGPRAGKGGWTRLPLVEAALSPLVLPIILDGKRGAGLPYLRDGAVLYAQTPEQWRIVLEGVVDMMRARMARHGANNVDGFTPGPGDPLVLSWADEWRYIKARWPHLVECAVELTGLGRGLGYAFGLNLQKGDAPAYGDAELRANIYANGSVWIGSAGDVAATGVALQSHDYDLAGLPAEPGWAYLASKVDATALTGVKMRTLWLPNRRNVEKGSEAPFGTVEDWLTETVTPALHPTEQAIFDRIREQLDADPDPEGTTPEARAAVPAARDRADDQILQLLLSLPDGEGMKSGAIAAETGINRQHVVERLGVLKHERGAVAGGDYKEWMAVRST